MAYLDETGLKHLWDKIIDKIYPVGSIYMSVNSTSPATIYGGTWEQIKGKFLLAEDGSTYKAGDEGGEASHTLTTNEIPPHGHTFISQKWFDASKEVDNGSIYSWWGTAPNELSKPYMNATNVSGGGAAHNNMPPYVAVYVWKRTA